MRAAIVALLFLAHAARANPSNETLVLVGAGMALPTYVIGVSLHESSHALAWTLANRESELDLLCLSGRGDKDLAEALRKLGHQSEHDGVAAGAGGSGS